MIIGEIIINAMNRGVVNTGPVIVGVVIIETYFWTLIIDWTLIVETYFLEY